MNNFTEQDMRPFLKDGKDAFTKAYKLSPKYKPDGSYQGVRELTGRFVYPTGAGKTVLQSFILRDMINKDGSDIHLVLAPRIVLLNQLINDYRKYIGTGYKAVAFHSGKMEPDFERVKWTERSTTSKEEIITEMAHAKSMGKDLVIFSTYHSVHKLLDLKFDTLIADESQYCVSENYFQSVKDLKAGVKLFFTATEKHSKTGALRGLNNEDVFGPIIGQECASNLIAAGYLVPPRLHIVYGKRDSQLNSFVDEAIKIAIFQDQETRTTMPASKILFACKGTKDVALIVENVKQIKKAMPNHKIFTIISNKKYGGMIDGVKLPKGNFMKELRECDNALVFHYDILSEGIDIDGITGVAIMRNMSQSKLLQTIGRALRIYKANPELKTQALVSVAVINNDDETEKFVQDIVTAMRDGGFEINFEDVIFPEFGSGVDDLEGDDDQYIEEARKKAQGTIKNVLHALEQIDKGRAQEDKVTEGLSAMFVGVWPELYEAAS